MRLARVRLRNFRGYEDQTVRVDDLTTLVGRNDAGKSTVLEALAIFFEANAPKIEANDRNKFVMADAVEIICTFADLPSELILDESARTTLEGEYLLNAAGELEIVKRWRIRQKITSEVFARALHPTAGGIADLLEVKIDELKRRLDAQGLVVEDRRKSPLIRQALLDAVREKELAEREVPLSGDGDGKKIWAQLEKELPLYVLFKADRATSDEDDEAQDPMKFAVRQALQEVADELQEIRERVQARVRAVAARTVEELRQIDPTLAGALEPTFKSDQKWDALFKPSLASDREIPLNKRGSGVKRLVLLSFLLGEVKRRQTEGAREAVIIAIEEPETALHPRQQELLVRTLLTLSAEPTVQVLVTTHAPALASRLPHQSLRLVRRDGADAVAMIIADDDTPTQIANELGVLTDPSRNQVRVVVCVEGPTDAAFLRRATTLLRAAGRELPDLDRDPRILVVPLGGGTLRHWVENHYLRNLRVPEVHIYDRDVEVPPKYQTQVDRVNQRNDGSQAFLTRKRELENYYPRTGIEAILGIPVSVAALGDVVDVCFVVSPARWALLHPGEPWGPLSERHKKNCAKRVKDALAAAITEHLSANGLADAGFADELAAWMRPVAAALEGAE